MTTEVEQSKLKINVLTEKQYEALPEVSDTELYIVDPQFQGQKFLGTDENGDIIEKDALNGVKVDGTDLAINNGKVDIPVAYQATKGVVSVYDAGYGIKSMSTGQLQIHCGDWAKFNNALTNPNQWLPIVTKDILLGMKAFLGTTITGSTSNTTWNDTEKEAACETLGAAQTTEIVDWIES